MTEEEADFSSEFLVRMLPRIDYTTLVAVATQLGHGSELPKAIPVDAATDDEFLQKLHHVLLEVNVVEGELECPESGTKFPITSGIPNMLIAEE